MACLFCFLSLLNASASTPLDDANQQILSLHLAEARKALNPLNGPLKIRLLSLINTTQLLLDGDEDALKELEPVFSDQLEALEKLKSPGADDYYALADIRLQWSFVYLKFGDYFQATWNLRQARLAAISCHEKFPEYAPVNKTSGLINVMLGAVPDRFQWLMNIFGMEGSVYTGLQELQQATHQPNVQGLESQFLLTLIKGYVLHQPDAAVHEVDSLLQAYPGNRLLLFMGASLAMKDSRNEQALNYLLAMKKTDGYAFALEDYMTGEALLRKGSYPEAIASYGQFLSRYKGESDRKDAHYKIGLCYWIKGDTAKANDYFDRARSQGAPLSEADSYANEELASGDTPNSMLLQIRFLTDGGYYTAASKIAASITPVDLPTKKDQVEYYYRKARIAHKQGQLEAAGLFYRQVIAMTDDEPWYFAPNACLQMGYIDRDEGKTDEASDYFHKALAYKKHEYKSSIQSEARSALAALNKN